LKIKGLYLVGPKLVSVGPFFGAFSESGCFGLAAAALYSYFHFNTGASRNTPTKNIKLMKIREK